MTTITLVQPQEPEIIELQALGADGSITATGLTSSHDASTSLPTTEISVETTNLELDDNAQTEATPQVVALDEPVSSESADGRVNDLTSAPQRPALSVSSPNLDRWQFRLNATNVLLGIIGLALVCFTINFTILDHRINRDSLILDQWTAQSYFRDKCLALMNTTSILKSDCKKVLSEPLKKPPIPLVRLYLRSALMSAYKVSQRMRHTPVQVFESASIKTIALGFGIFLLFLFLLLAVLGIGRHQRGQNSASIHTQDTFRSSTIPAWVGNSLPRSVEQIQTACTTGAEIVAISLRLRRRDLEGDDRVSDWDDVMGSPFTSKDWESTMVEDMSEKSAITDTQVNDLTKSTAPSESPRPSTPIPQKDLNEDISQSGPQSSIKDNSLDSEPTQNQIIMKENGNDDARNNEKESEWLPTATDAGYSKTSYPRMKTTKVVEFIIDRLMALGYETFAFDFLKPGERISEYFSRERYFEDSVLARGVQLSAYSASTASCAFPTEFFESLTWDKVFTASEVATWCIALPDLSLDEAIVCYVESPSQPLWRLWRPKTTQGTTNNEPLLHVVSTSRGYGPRSVHLLFSSLMRSEFESPRKLLPAKLNLMELFGGKPARIMLSGAKAIDSLLKLQLYKSSDFKTYMQDVKTDGSNCDVLSGTYHLDDSGGFFLVKNDSKVPKSPKSNDKVDQPFILVPKPPVASSAGSKRQAVSLPTTSVSIPTYLLDNPKLRASELESKNFWCTWIACSACFSDADTLAQHERGHHLHLEKINLQGKVW